MNTDERTPKNANDNLCVFLKGAPDRVWSRCKTILNEGNPEPLNAHEIEDLKAANDKFGNMGERVLGFSRLYLDPNLGNDKVG